MGSLQVEKFPQLVADIKTILGSSSGKDVDPKILHSLLSNYTSHESDWKDYAFPDPSRLYTRNLVDEGNGKSNLVRCQETIEIRDMTGLLTIGTVDHGVESGPAKCHP